MTLDALTTPLFQSLTYLTEVIHARLHHYFQSEHAGELPENIPLPIFNGRTDPFSSFLREHTLNKEELWILLIALAPNVQPDFFDFIHYSMPNEGDYPQLGGVRGKQHRGFLPTGETALFILSGGDPTRRLQVQQYFDEDHLFAKKQVLFLEPAQEHEPPMSGRLRLSQEYLDLFTRGKHTKPKFSTQFPAQEISTDMEWEDLVLPPQTMQQIKHLENWIQHGGPLLHDWGMKKRLKLGYRALFHGPPGTGKTLTASLLGKFTGKAVYKVDLSMVVSKFIGETEKNLANLFTRAESKGWILFFDEADALFGKRTNVRDAHDKYANQEVSYLLQRVENYDGLVILASNFKNNIDDAFLRRFQSLIHFPMPGPEERLQLWKKAFPPQITLAPEVKLSQLANKYEVSGSSIMNIVQFACLETLAQGLKAIPFPILLEGLRREFSKEGKIV